jgi:hypothetical protein
MLRLEDLDYWSASAGASGNEKGYHDNGHQHHCGELPERGREGTSSSMANKSPIPPGTPRIAPARVRRT